MAVFASVVSSSNDHGYEAGRYVAQHALAAFETAPTVFIAAIGQQHNPEEVVRGMRSITKAVPLIGSSARTVMTMAGNMPKGVGLLALRAAETQPGVSLITGLHSQPAPAAQRAADEAQGNISDRQPHRQTTGLVLTAGTDAETLPTAWQTVQDHLPTSTTLVGAVSGTGNACVFVNDQVSSDALALGLLQLTAPVGVGLAYTPQAEPLEAAQQAAHQSVAALDGQPPAAALIVIGEAVLTSLDNVDESLVEPVRHIIGRTTPLIGIAGSGGIAAPAGTPDLHQQAVLVYVIGSG